VLALVVEEAVGNGGGRVFGHGFDPAAPRPDAGASTGPRLNLVVRIRGTTTGGRLMGPRLVATLVAMVLVVVGCGTAGTAAAPVVTADGVQGVEVAFAGGEVTGGVRRYAVPLGSTVELVVASDVAEQVHLHGYDRMVYVTAGATATLRFAADLPGVFDVELEGSGTPLTQLQIA
jgi:hypothetical protein